MFRRWQKGPSKTPARRPGKRGSFPHVVDTAPKNAAPTSGFAGAETSVCAKTDPKNVPLFVCTHAKHEELYKIVRKNMQ